MKSKKQKHIWKGNKQLLPSKICPVCTKIFTRRKKWKNNWSEVKYCSKKCKQRKQSL